MIKYILFFISTIIIVTIYSCGIGRDKKTKPLSEEQVVDGLVNLYSIDAKLSESTVGNDDSLRSIYMEAYFTGKGFSKSDFDANIRVLKNFPDSFNILQSRALDTIRVLLEQSYQLSIRPDYEVN